MFSWLAASKSRLTPCCRLRYYKKCDQRSDTVRDSGTFHTVETRFQNIMDNVSVIMIFYLSGLNEPKNIRFILFSLSLVCYCVILLVNLTLIVTIILDKNLHEPMYILLCAFCMNGLYGTTGFFPKFLWDLLSPVHVNWVISALLFQTGHYIEAHFVCSQHINKIKSTEMLLNKKKHI